MRAKKALLMLALCLRPWGTLGAESFASWAAKAERARKSHDETAALGAYTSALLLWKKSDGRKAKVKVLSGRAELYEKAGEPAKAVKDLSAALSLDAKNASLYHRRGLAYLELSNLSSAISDLYKATALDLNFKEAYLDRARAYELQGDLEFAKEDYKTACRLGLKKACASAKTVGKKPKAKPKPAVESVQLVSKSTAPKAASGPSKPAPTVEASPAPPQAAPAAPAPTATPAPPKPEFSACRRALNACVENGDGFGSCVQKAKACEDNPEKPTPGCCPRACLKRFSALVDADESEAQAFREVFSPKSPCAPSP